MYQDEQYAALIFTPEIVNSAEVSEIASILGLQPGLAVYEVKLARQGQIQPALGGVGELGRLPPVEEYGTRKDITVSTRSLLETMFYLSQGIQVPCEHLQQGLVTVTLDHHGEPFDRTEMTGDLLRVLV